MSDPGAPSPAGPRTAAGQLLRAALLGELDTRAEVQRFVMMEDTEDLAEFGDAERVAERLTPEVLASFTVIPAVFGIVVRRRFGARPDIRDITRYVREACARGTLDLDFSMARQAEAVIRSALGEPHVADGIPADDVGVAMSCVLFDLVRCQALADQEVDALLAEAERAMGGNGVGTECRMP